MPPRKRNARAAQSQAVSVPVQSDYETDTLNLTDVASNVNHLPSRRTNTELNLAVLQRYLPGIETIVAIAPFAVVYIFSAESQAWEKTGQEGTLFVCQLSGPRWTVMVLNRKSLDNFIMELNNPEDVELTAEYVILQDTAAEDGAQIYGLWIFDDLNETGTSTGTREFVAQTIEECAVRAAQVAEEQGDHTAVKEHTFEEAQEETPFVRDQGQQLDVSQLFAKPPQGQQMQEPIHPHQGFPNHLFPQQNGVYNEPFTQPQYHQQGPPSYSHPITQQQQAFGVHNYQPTYDSGFPQQPNSFPAQLNQYPPMQSFYNNPPPHSAHHGVAAHQQQQQQGIFNAPSQIPNGHTMPMQQQNVLLNLFKR